MNSQPEVIEVLEARPDGDEVELILKVKVRVKAKELLGQKPFELFPPVTVPSVWPDYPNAAPILPLNPVPNGWWNPDWPYKITVTAKTTATTDQRVGDGWGNPLFLNTFGNKEIK